jgi:hypothetical protein
VLVRKEMTEEKGVRGGEEGRLLLLLLGGGGGLGLLDL